MTGRLHGEVAVITGAASGIGRASTFVTGVVRPVDGGASAIYAGSSQEDIGSALEAFRSRKRESNDG